MKYRKKRRSNTHAMKYFAFWTFGIVLFMSTVHLAVLYSRANKEQPILPHYRVNAPEVMNLSKVISRKNYNIPNTQFPEFNKNQSHVMLFGYMRGGTTFLGEILGLRPGTFYVYEPLLGATPFDYFEGNKICNVWTGQCREGHEKQGGIEGAKKYINDIYQCQLQAMDSIDVLNKIAMGQRLDNWTLLNECKHLDTSSCPSNKNRSPHLSKELSCRQSQLECLKNIQKVCSNSKVVLTKTLRLSMNDTETILAKDPNFKLIHLIRDPRAVIHSRYKIWSKYCLDNISLCSRGLCDKMAKDHIAFNWLKTKYPQRMYSLYYEHFISDPVNYIKAIFKFTWSNFTSFDELQLKVRVEANEKARFKTNVWSTIRAENSLVSSRKWRRTIRPIHLAEINKECSHVFKLYKYKILTLKSEIQNMHVSTLL